MRFVATILATLVLATGGCQTQQPEEDDPNWDCHKHGNQKCGPGKGI